MKKALLFLAGATMAATSSFGAATTLYGIGDCFGGWGENTGKELTSTSAGVFTAEVEVTGTAYFAFCEKLGSWTDINGTRYAPAVKDTEAKAGETLDMVYGQDASWKLLPGKYTFTIDTNALKLKVEGGGGERVITYAIHGQMMGLADTDWATYPMEKKDNDDNVWTTKLTPSVSGGEFGIIQQINGSQSEWHAAKISFNEETPSGVLNGEPAGNCVFDYTANKEYIFTYTVSTETLNIVPAETGAVSEIEMEDGTVVYFNLQGVQVENPENGLFIKVTGNKAQKVIL